MGIYYMAPLLGPSMGPLLGGALTTGFNWRAIFWFLTVVSGMEVFAFLLFFNDTFRRERSTIYQNAVKKRLGVKTSSPTEEAVPGTTLKVFTNEKQQTQVAAKSIDLEGNATALVTQVNIKLTEINPIKPILLVLRRKNNSLTLFSSGKLPHSLPKRQWF